MKAAAYTPIQEVNVWTSDYFKDEDNWVIELSKDQRVKDLFHDHGSWKVLQNTETHLSFPSFDTRLPAIIIISDIVSVFWMVPRPQQ